MKEKVKHLLPYLITVSVYLFVYGWVALRGKFDFAAVEYLYQSMGAEALTEEPVQSLLVSHIQPPGMNAIFAIALNTTVDASVILQILFCFVGAATALLVVATLINLNQSRLLAGSAGVLFGLLPTTALYVMWPYNTAIVALCGALGFYGLSVMNRSTMRGALTWTVAIVGVFLVRPSLVWLIAIVALAAPMYVMRQWRRPGLLILAAAGCTVILTVQAHHFVQFGSLTTSSWSGQNLVKGLVFSGVATEQDLAEAAGEDACLRSLAKNPEFWGDLSGVDPECFGSRSDLNGTAIALDLEFKKDTENIQQNSIRRLELAPAWNTLAFNVIRQNPLSVPEMLFGVGSGASSFEVMLEPGHTFRLVQENLVAGTPVVSIMRPVGTLFPAGSIALILVGLLALMRGYFPSGHVRRFYLVGVAAVGYSILTATLFEFGENQRFLVEIYPILLVLAALVVGLLTKDRKSDQGRISSSPSSHDVPSS